MAIAKPRSVGPIHVNNSSISNTSGVRRTCCLPPFPLQVVPRTEVPKEEVDLQVLCVEPNLDTFAHLVTMRRHFFGDKVEGVQW